MDKFIVPINYMGEISVMFIKIKELEGCYGCMYYYKEDSCNSICTVSTYITKRLRNLRRIDWSVTTANYRVIKISKLSLFSLSYIRRLYECF